MGGRAGLWRGGRVGRAPGPPQHSRRGSGCRTRGPGRGQAPGPSPALGQTRPRRSERDLCGAGRGGPGASPPPQPGPRGALRRAGGRAGGRSGAGAGARHTQAGDAAVRRQGAPERSWLPAARRASGRELGSGTRPFPATGTASSRHRLLARAAGPALPRAGPRPCQLPGRPRRQPRPRCCGLPRLRPRMPPTAAPPQAGPCRGVGSPPHPAAGHGDSTASRCQLPPTWPQAGRAAKGQRSAAAGPLCPSHSHPEL